MHIREARELVGLTATLTYHDRKGEEVTDTTYIYKADFVPMYGPCLFTDHGEIHLDRIMTAIPLVAEERKAS